MEGGTSDQSRSCVDGARVVQHVWRSALLEGHVSSRLDREDPHASWYVQCYASYPFGAALLARNLERRSREKATEQGHEKSSRLSPSCKRSLFEKFDQFRCRRTSGILTASSCGSFPDNNLGHASGPISVPPRPKNFGFSTPNPTHPDDLPVPAKTPDSASDRL